MHLKGSRSIQPRKLLFAIWELGSFFKLAISFSLCQAITEKAPSAAKFIITHTVICCYLVEVRIVYQASGML